MKEYYLEKLKTILDILGIDISMLDEETEMTSLMTVLDSIYLKGRLDENVDFHMRTIDK